MIAVCFPRGSISKRRGSILLRTRSNFPGRRRGDRILMRGPLHSATNSQAASVRRFRRLPLALSFGRELVALHFWIFATQSYHSRIQHSMSALRARSGRSLEVRLTAISDLGAIGVCPTPLSERLLDTVRCRVTEARSGMTRGDFLGVLSSAAAGSPVLGIPVRQRCAIVAMPGDRP